MQQNAQTSTKINSFFILLKSFTFVTYGSLAVRWRTDAACISSKGLYLSDLTVIATPTGNGTNCANSDNPHIIAQPNPVDRISCETPVRIIKLAPTSATRNPRHAAAAVEGGTEGGCADCVDVEMERRFVIRSGPTLTPPNAAENTISSWHKPRLTRPDPLWRITCDLYGVTCSCNNIRQCAANINRLLFAHERTAAWQWAGFIHGVG